MFNPSEGASSTNDATRGGSATGGSPTKENEWLKLAKDADNRSTTYFDNNFRKPWEDDLRMFQSKHPKDSKYNADSYKYRSRIFRPKSRSVVRKNEATAALAFFSNPDVLNLEPENTEDMNQIIGAELMQHVLQYRLTKTIPWFLTVIGGYQDAMTVGIVASTQTWRYRQRMEKKTVTAIDPVTQQPVQIEQDVPKILEDRPWVDLFPVENILFDPAAHWYDVVATSPYIILKIPMYLNDVLDRMESEDKEGRKWKRLSKDVILKARVDPDDSMRQARTEAAEDPQGVTSQINEFDVVMVHLNFIRRGETCYAYYTLKSTNMLSDPIPVEEMFLHCKDGRPPVQIGFCVLETHKAVPTSLIGLGKELQKEANEIVNQRLDNVKYVLNKRSLVRRGANVDVDSLLRNVPGGITMVNDVEKDIREVNWQDVTSSSYQEQNLVNGDFDELAGNFAQSSVDSNRRLNETVGGMKLMAQGANTMTEYSITVFAKTWVEPVLRQLIKLEAAYETDEVILALAASNAKLFPKYGVNTVTDSMLNHELTLTVNIGQGATDPDSRLQRFTHATQVYTAVEQSALPDMDMLEFRKEIYGLAGFQNSMKFFKAKIDPQVEQAMKVAHGAEAKAKEMIDREKFALLERARKLDEREQAIKLQEFEAQNNIAGEVQKAHSEFMLSQAESANQMRIASIESAHQMAMDEEELRQKLRLEREDAAAKILIDNQKAHNDMMIAKQEAHNAAMLAAAKAPRTKSAKKVNGEWKVTETVQ